jgi:hypothetical protein
VLLVTDVGIQLCSNNGYFSVMAIDVFAPSSMSCQIYAILSYGGFFPYTCVHKAQLASECAVFDVSYNGDGIFD